MPGKEEEEEEEEEEDEEEEEEKKEKEDVLIESKNPHLAGGEKALIVHFPARHV